MARTQTKTQSKAAAIPKGGFAVAADTVLFAVIDSELSVLLVKRGNDPEAGKLALPGGFADSSEDLEAAARRELTEETGVSAGHLQQLGAYGDPGRDPRGRVVSVVFWGVIAEADAPVAGDDAVEADWYAVAPLLRGRSKLAFDHRQILQDAKERVALDVGTTSIATHFLGEEFTLSDLREVFQAVWEVEIDPGNFTRKFTQTEELLVNTGWVRSPVGKGRPAAIYAPARTDVVRLVVPITRPAASR